MRLILFDGPPEKRANFRPLSFSRPVWELRCGMSTLGERLIAKVRPSEVACFVEPYMAAAYKTKTDRKVKDLTALRGSDLLLVSGRVKADSLGAAATGPSEVAVDEDGNVLYARVAKGDLAKLPTDSLEGLLDAAKKAFAQVAAPETWNYTWDLILANSEQLRRDFAAAGHCGIEGTVEQLGAIRGSDKDVYVAPGALVHPMVVLDASGGPIYIDTDAEIHPFTRIEGPCYIGKKSILLGTKCRGGNTIGPACRVGGEIEESIIHGHSNKYHDGFLGHAYVGEWVNLGALTSNSDL